MQKIIASIRLVSLTSKKHEEALSRQLTALGADVSITNSSHWLQGKVTDPNGIFVLLLPATDVPVKKIINAMSTTPRSNYLVIFFPPITQDVCLILDACDDCSNWASDESELAFRLNRILLRHKESIRSAYTQIENKVWADLNLLGMSKVFRDVLSIIERAAHCDASVLIEGETGCGKEMVARAIHYLSCRKDYPFIPINCGAVPDHLIENELFGHEKGAYTDAKQSYSGSIEQADGGTLFLDEIEALSAKGQVTLLRFIEDKMIKPLGGRKCKKIDVRIIVASNVSLAELVDQALFRKDLLYRLNLLYLYLPPLRNRENDIQYLAEIFMQKYRLQYEQPDKQIHPQTVAWMNSYHWPGNVRELENFIHRSFLLSEDVYVRPKAQHITDEQPNSRRKLFDRRLNFQFDASFADAKNHVIGYFEKRYLSWLLSKSNGNVTLAADIAKKERRALGKLLKKNDINPAQYRNH
jgi:DNA-binding NtrC family response regulator